MSMEKKERKKKKIYNRKVKKEEKIWEWENEKREEKDKRGVAINIWEGWIK
jgi:hypothetical protein